MNQSWQKLGFSSERHRTRLPGSNEEDISFGIDAVGDDERADQDAKAHGQGDELQGRQCAQMISVQFGVIAWGWEPGHRIPGAGSRHQVLNNQSNISAGWRRSLPFLKEQ